MAQLELFPNAAEWLLPSSDSLWRWDEEGEAIIWQDGTTLIFREELAQMVERLAGEGLPPLNLIILLVAATRGKYPSWEDVLGRMAPLLDKAAKDGDLTPIYGLDVQEKATEFYLEALARLRLLSRYPAELLAGVSAKVHLVERVATGVRKGAVAQAQSILAMLREDFPLLEVLSPAVSQKNGNLLGDLFELHSALGELTPESLQFASRTGLQSPPEAKGVELPPGECMKRFLRELQQDAEYSGMARLTRDIMATLSLPKALEHPETQAMGGLSDITNRGPLHRLLVSELAHDNDTLAIRVAMNEALYLRNEPPAARPRSELIIVVDAGIRMWGIPRIFATAAAMALMAKTDKATDMQVFRSRECNLLPIELASREGLTRHLAALETHLHPGVSLEALPQNGTLPIDLALITHPRSLREPSFQAALEQLDIRHLYLITVDREGTLQLDLRSPAGTKTLQRAHLSLAEVMGSENTKTLRNDAARLPAILSLQPFPILLPLPDAIDRTLALPGGGFVAVTKAGVVCRWQKKQWGANVFPISLFEGPTKAFLYNENLRCVILVKYRAPSQELVLFHWYPERDPDFCAADNITVYKNAPGDPLDVFERYGFLYFTHIGLVEVIDLAGGISRGSFPTPIEMTYVGEGFYFDKGSGFLNLLAWSGTKLETHELKLPPMISAAKVIRVFYPRGKSAWIVDSGGTVASTSDQDLCFKTSMAKVFDVSFSVDGLMVWLQGSQGFGTLVDIEKREVKELPQKYLKNWINPPIPQPVWTMRVRFTHVAVEDSGHIWLRSGKGIWNRIEFEKDRFHLVRYEKNKLPGGESDLNSALPFKPAEAPADAWYTLQSVTWPDGSRAFLDSRGLLHLQSSRVEIPELCIVLAESTSVPVWSSDGLRVGPSFFVGDLPPAHPDGKKLDETIRRFVGEIL